LDREKLNVHLDCSIHLKLGLERRLNLILYITSGWRPEWGGQLGLWEGSRDKMGQLCRHVDCLFNRAVIFDTTQNSCHGLPDAIRCPRGVIRKSLAAYYLTAPRSGLAERGKALFAPHGEQKMTRPYLSSSKKGPKLLRRKKFIGSILEKRRKESQGKNPLFVCEKRGKGGDREADLVCKRPSRA